MTPRAFALPAVLWIVGFVLVAICTGSGAANAALDTQEYVLEFDADQVTLRDGDAGVVVGYPRAYSILGRPGAPALPARVVQFEIPDNRTVESVSVDVLAIERVGDAIGVAALAVDHHVGDQPSDVDRDATIYMSDAVYPAELARFAGRGGLRGHTVASIQVTPWIYRPRSGSLELVTRLRVRVHLSAASSIVLERNRVDPVIEARFEQSARRLLTGELRSLAPSTARGAGGSGPARPGPYQPTFRPTSDGSPVEYVIVTNEELAPEFERLADWKRQKGVMCEVRTVEWIDQTYPNGVDQAERVRFFLADAYQNWGALWALLGGDTDVVPHRLVRTELDEGNWIPADYYFMCLEGNWNLDGDHLFGEGKVVQTEEVDGADLLPEIFVGRAPVSTPAEASAFIDKTLDYARDPQTGNGYPASAVFLAERLFDDLDGAAFAEAALTFVPPEWRTVRLYEEFDSWPGALALDRESAIDSVNSGFGLVHHVGHGFRNTMSVGESSLTNADADNLMNGNRTAFVFGINCSSASIDFNSIGERWAKNPNGGGVAYFGTSRLAYVTSSGDMQEEWFSLVFEQSVSAIGEACTLMRLPFAGAAAFDNVLRWMVMTLTLLGDPELAFYSQEIAPLDLAHAPTHELGTGPLSVSVTTVGVPVENARVALWRSGEMFVTAQTDASGIALFDIVDGTAGDATLTVKEGAYQPQVSTVTLTAATGAYPTVLTVFVDDNNAGESSGDSDGRADAGETVELSVLIGNSGAQDLTGASGTLTATDPDGYLSIISDTVPYDTIVAGGSGQGTSKFVVSIDPTTPVAYQPPMTVTLTSDQGVFSGVFVLPVRRAYLEHLDHQADDTTPGGNANGDVDAGDEIWYTIDLRNSGQETAFSVDATMRALRASDMMPEPLVSIADDTMSFGDIDIDQTVTGDRFEFTLDGTLDPGAILLEVTYDDLYGQSWVELLDVVKPGVVDSVRAFGTTNAVTLNWNVAEEDTDILGYDIFRGPTPIGPFEKINAFLAEGSAHYEDRGLPPLTRFYYRVVARDSSYNAGPGSVIFSGQTNPPLADGWPIAVTQPVQSSIQIADIDGDSGWELFTAADYQYGWNADGSELFDGDDDARTSGVISELGFDPEKGFGATTAIGDVDGDGDQEILNVAWNVREAYLWDSQGQIMPGWPKNVQSDFNWASPVLADLDDDGDLEIIIWAAQGGRLFAWHHDGQEVFDGDGIPGTDGVLRRITGISFNFSSPAVGNLDADPELEIVFCSNLYSDSSQPRGGIWVINADGSDVPGWPVMTGDPFHSNISASPVIVDFDGVGGNEILIASEREGGRVHIFNADASDYPGWPVTVPSAVVQTRVASPVPADVDNDGSLDVIYPDSNGTLWVWNRQANVLPGFPVNYVAGLNEPTQSTPAVGDIDDDGYVEILFGDESGRLLAYNHNGTEVNGFPIQTNGEVRATPAIWDIDGDNLVEIILAAWDQNIYVWDLPYAWNPQRVPWPFFRHDQWNTGNFDGPIQIGVAEPAAAPAAASVIHPPYPNPFNPRTRFSFEVAGEAARPVVIAVYDVQGRLVRRLIDGLVDPGAYSVEWDGRTMRGKTASTGVYLYRAQVGTVEASGKLTLVK